MTTRPDADVLFAHDGGRREPGPPDVALQRRARALGRPFWWSGPVGIAGLVVAGAGFVLDPQSAPGVALMVAGLAVAVATVAARRIVGPRYGAATQAAGLPVPADRADELAAVARTFEAVLRDVERAGEDGVLPPRTRRFHTLTRRWDRTTDRVRGRWLGGDETGWREGVDLLVARGPDAEAFGREVAEHVERHRERDSADGG